MKTQRQVQRGFTIVELAVVIAVIAILVTITAIAYPRYLERANNDTRRHDVAQISTALKSYAQAHNDYMAAGSGCGYGGNGGGWATADSSTAANYQKSIVDCLKASGDLKSDDDFIDPSGCVVYGSQCPKPVTTYMKTNCIENGQQVAYVLAYLPGEPDNTAAANAACNKNWGTAYGMNYVVKVE